MGEGDFISDVTISDVANRIPNLPPFSERVKCRGLQQENHLFWKYSLKKMNKNRLICEVLKAKK